jgi:tripartite-type tricarboxylate transporter receptor subunit TctC
LNKSKRSFCAALSFCALAGFMNHASAQEFPDRPIKLLVGFSAGSTVDAVARAVADGLTKRFGQPVIVENKTGANGALATETVARSKPDGYTLLVSNTSSLTVNPLLYKNLGYSVPKDFAPITTIVTYPLVLTVNPTNPKMANVKTLADFVALGKSQQNPPLSFGSGGNGNFLQIASEQLIRAAGFRATHIPYRGGAPMQMALLANEVDFNFDTLTAVPQIKAGKLRALAVSESTRWEDLPDVPTVAELGFPSVQFSAWLALIAPAGTPPRVIDTIHQAMSEIVKDPAVRMRLQTQGRVSIKSPKALRDQINAELALNADIIKKANISID